MSQQPCATAIPTADLSLPRADSYAEASDGTASTTPTATPTSVQSHADVLDSELGSLMECAAYWAARGVVPQYASNGHYSGWVNPELMGMLGIATSAKQVRFVVCCVLGALCLVVEMGWD